MSSPVTRTFATVAAALPNEALQEAGRVIVSLAVRKARDYVRGGRPGRILPIPAIVIPTRFMRLFIGLTLPKKQRARIHRATRSLREGDLPVRWVEADNLHVTLKFLGEVRKDNVPAIEEVLSRIASSTRAFTAALGGFGAFPTVRRPRVIWLGLEATPELRCLKQDLEWTLGDVGFEVETRAFHPHVTLGRAKKDHGAGVFRGLDETFASMEFHDDLRVHTVDLMESRLSASGPRYRTVLGARLAAA